MEIKDNTHSTGGEKKRANNNKMKMKKKKNEIFIYCCASLNTLRETLNTNFAIFRQFWSSFKKNIKRHSSLKKTILYSQFPSSEKKERGEAEFFLFT